MDDESVRGKCMWCRKRKVKDLLFFRRNDGNNTICEGDPRALSASASYLGTTFLFPFPDKTYDLTKSLRLGNSQDKALTPIPFVRRPFPQATSNPEPEQEKLDILQKYAVLRE